MTITNSATPSSASIGAMISHHQEVLGLTDLEVSKAIGYDRGTVIMLIKQGSMRLPVNKVSVLAKALNIDAIEALRAVMREQSPGLLDAIEDILSPLQLTDTEVNLVRHLRTVSAGREAKPIVFDGSMVIALVAA